MNAVKIITDFIVKTQFFCFVFSLIVLFYFFFYLLSGAHVHNESIFSRWYCSNLNLLFYIRNNFFFFFEKKNNFPPSKKTDTQFIQFPRSYSFMSLKYLTIYYNFVEICKLKNIFYCVREVIVNLFLHCIYHWLYMLNEMTSNGELSFYKFKSI